MMTEKSFDQVLSVANGSDLSLLVGLRVLITSSRGDEWIGRKDLVDRLIHDVTAVLPHSSAARNAGSGETERYLEEHVLQRLHGDGILEYARPEHVGEEELETPVDWLGVRFASPLREELASNSRILLNRIEERLQELDSAASLPVSVGGPSATAEIAPTDDRPRLTLSAKGLVKVYRKRHVVNDVALEVSEGEIVGLLGPNGAGKTTTFYMMVGLIEPDGGRVSLGDEDVTKVPMYRRARRGVGYLSQEPSIFRKLTVEENVKAILQMRKFPKREQKERLEHLLGELDIKHLRHSKAYALSGGERRRLEITRALVGDPRFMLLDEPFAGVDPIAVHDIQQIVADLRGRGIGVLISDHNVEQTLDIVDRAYIMYDGRVRVGGTVSELVWNDEVAEIYLGPTLTARMRQRYSRPE